LGTRSIGHQHGIPAAEPDAILAPQRGQEMRTFLGLLSILAFLGLVGFIALDRYFRWNDAEPVATWKTNERRAKLLERLDVEISAQRHRWLRQRAGMALLALLLSALFFSMHWLPSFRSAQTPDNQRDQPVASERGTLASVLDAAAVPWFGFASLLVIGLMPESVRQRESGRRRRVHGRRRAGQPRVSNKGTQN
jgi:hypothetical protein